MALFSKDQTPIPSKPAPRGDTPSLLGMPKSAHADIVQKPTPRTKSTDDAPNPSESRLIVGPNIKLKGVEIEDCDTLVVEGYVEASMDSRVIEISETGVYEGKVEIDTAIIRGRFRGDLTARDRLVIHASGDVGGKIRYGRLSIEEGGRVHGDLDELGVESASDAVAAREPKAEKSEDIPTKSAAEA